MTVTPNSKITEVSNPVYVKEDNSQIDCQVTFDNGKVYPYTAGATDNTPYGKKLWADLIAGEHGTIAPYIPPLELGE